MITNRSRPGTSVWVLMPCLLAGCGPQAWRWNKEATTQPAGASDSPDSLRDARRAIAMEGTVGAVAYVQGTRFMRVRGYGLVSGLNGQGSPFCPPDVRDHLVREIRRFRSSGRRAQHELTPQQLIDSLDTAVVEITGDIPAGAAKGHTFDVIVSASSTSADTRSLAGGYLLPCELKIFREVSPAEIIEGRTHAKARGPVFINPFARAGGSGAGTDPREGRVIGGGVNLIDRRLSLITAIESYSTVAQVAAAINQRFNRDPKMATDTDPSHVALTIPPDLHGSESRVLEMILHLPLSSSPAVREARAKTLVAELARPGLPPEDAALSLEGIGPLVIPMIQELYTHPRRQVNYYAARTGLRLGDDPATEVIIRHARDPRSPFRRQAIRELGRCPTPARAAVALRGLLADSDPLILIDAYEALRKVDPESIASGVVGRDPGNFIIDVVPSDGPALIYARKTECRRIALIGANHMVVRPPLFYAKPGRQVTLSSLTNDAFITVLRKESGSVIGDFIVPLDVVVLTRFMGDDPRMGADGKPQGLGLDYAVVLDVLYHLCETGAIDAGMKWEEQRVEDLIGPLRPMGRPESEL